MKYIVLLLVSLSLPVYAGGRHDPHPVPTPAPIPAPVNVQDNDSDSSKNLFLFTAIVFTAWCISEKCWKEKPVKTADTMITPEIPTNEYITIRQKKP